MTVTSVRLKSDIERPLELLAKKMDRSKNYIINQAVGEYLERKVLSDQHWQETLPVLESMGAVPGVPADEVYEWLRSKGTDNELPRPKSK
jgi:predicted transcriptional regulator